ncbi:MAG: response regulator, partial [Anaerolineae bacterium]|nr:response regulator [Anaerolineae bacterium]
MDNDIKPRTILLIDNEADIQKSFTAHLASQGFRVLTAQNSQTGLNILEDEPPDIVLTTLHMPGGDGLEVVKRGAQLYPEMPIIVMAGYDQSNESIQAIELGAWDYMVKSTNNLPILDHVIGKAVERVRLLQENHNYKEKLKHSIEQDSPSNNRSQETNRSQQLLLALSQAAQAIQRAHTPEAVYQATGAEIAKLGFDTIIFTLSNEKNSLIISYLTLKSNIIQVVKRLLGL